MSTRNMPDADPERRNVLVVSTVEEVGTALRAELQEEDVVNRSQPHRGRSVRFVTMVGR